MSGEEKNNRSLTHISRKRFRFSQIVIVVLLSISIGVAVIVALPAGWKNISEQADTTENFTDSIDESGKTGRETLGELRSLIQEFKSVMSDSPPEQLAVETKNVTSTIQSEYETILYINYDWSVSFQLPHNWNYSRKEEAFITSGDRLGVQQMKELEIPESWSLDETVHRYYDTDEATTTYYYIVDREDTALIFTDTDEQGLSDKKNAIITSLKAL